MIGEGCVMMRLTKRAVAALVVAGSAVAVMPAMQADAASTNTHRLSIQADFVLGSAGVPPKAPVCVPNAAFHAGEDVVWRAIIGDASTGAPLTAAQIQHLGVTAAVKIKGGATFKMKYEAHPPAQMHPMKQDMYWVAVWKIAKSYPMGPVAWTIKVKDAAGDTATFAPIGQDLGIPSIIIVPAVAPPAH
jgi:hypothetical protein